MSRLGLGNIGLGTAMRRVGSNSSLSLYVGAECVTAVTIHRNREAVVVKTKFGCSGSTIQGRSAGNTVGRLLNRDPAETPGLCWWHWATRGRSQWLAWLACQTSPFDGATANTQSVGREIRATAFRVHVWVFGAEVCCVKWTNVVGCCNRIYLRLCTWCCLWFCPHDKT